MKVRRPSHAITRPSDRATAEQLRRRRERLHARLARRCSPDARGQHQVGGGLVQGVEHKACSRLGNCFPGRMAEASLTVSSKNYSSWSLRGWLLCKMAGLDFDEKVAPLDDPATRAELLLLSPSFLVPCLEHGPVKVWDTLAIAEYLNELKPDAGLLPADPVARLYVVKVLESLPGVGKVSARRALEELGIGELDAGRLVPIVDQQLDPGRRCGGLELREASGGVLKKDGGDLPDDGVSAGRVKRPQSGERFRIKRVFRGHVRWMGR